jgi:hypothetical protein
MIDFLAGAIAMASFVAGLVFLRFHRRTSDRLFLFFAASFWLDAFGRTLEVALRLSNEDSPVLYVIRIVAYGLILIGILDKNRPHKRP